MGSTTAADISPEAFIPLVFGFAIYQIASTTARLGVIDELGGGPRTVAELAGSAGADPAALHRLLRAAVAAGMLQVEEDGRFALSPIGRLFDRDSEWLIGITDAMHSHSAVWQAWGGLEQAVRTGRPAFDVAHGMDIFEYTGKDQGFGQILYEVMTAGNEQSQDVLNADYDFGTIRHLVDLGGGDGTRLASILGANPELRGTVFDVEEALQHAPGTIEAAGLSDRCGTAAGDMSVAVPAGDGYLLKNVLADRDDAGCVRILRACRAAMPPDGKVLVIGLLVEDGPGAGHSPQNLTTAIRDIDVMVLTSGRERTLAEYGQLFTDAGLRLEAVTPLSFPCYFTYYVIEAFAA